MQSLATPTRPSSLNSKSIEKLLAIGIPMGIEHDPRPGAPEPRSSVRLGGRVFQLDDEAMGMWTQALRAPAPDQLRAVAVGRGIGGDPVADLMAAGLVRPLDDSCLDLVLIPQGIAIGNSLEAPATFEVQVGAGRPIGMDAITFAVWSESFRGRSLHAACREVAHVTNQPILSIARHVLNQSSALLGLIFFLDLAPGGEA